MQWHGKTITPPLLPGVYFFKNARGGILYIGKAANLHSRLRSYFQAEGNKASAKTAALIRTAKSIDWEVLGSETEAFIREAELIKKYHPKYNVLMRDDKQYLSAGFTKEKFPKIFVTHQTQHIDAHYIGPFTESGTLRTVLKMLRRIFPYCTCKQQHRNPCLNARMGRCLGFCCIPDTRSFSRLKNGPVSAYSQNIKSIKKILSGKNRSLLHTLKKEMKRLSRAQRYEGAARMRDQILALEKIFEHKTVLKQDVASDRTRALRALEKLLGISEIKRVEGYDISNIHGKHAYGSMVVFEEGVPKKEYYRIFKIKGAPHPDDPRMIREVIARRLRHPEWPYPDVMLIDGGKAQLNAALAARFISTKNAGFVLAAGFERRAGKDREARAQRETLSPACRAGRGKRENKSSVSEIKIVALAKREEELYLPYYQRLIKLKESSEPLYQLLTHIRDEAHRFAIAHYRKAHRKKLVT